MSLVLLSKRLKALREKHNLTQQNIGDYLNITRQGYSHYENGTRTPDVYLLEQLASLYHITMEELITGIKKPKREVVESPDRYLAYGLSPQNQKILYYYLKLPSDYQEAFWDLLMLKWQYRQGK